MSKLHEVKSVSNLSEYSADLTEATEASESSSIGESRKVSFGDIHIREYERIVGDHPDTRIGVPLAIGWGFVELDPKSVDEYESAKSDTIFLRMSSITRKNILHNVFGIPEEELRAAEKEVQKIRKSREYSAKQSVVSAKTESAFRAARRKIRRALSSENFMKGVSAFASSAMIMPMTVQ